MIFFTSSANIISNALTIISGLIILRWLLPTELGYFNSFTVISGYIVLAHIGTPAALNRDLPFLMGKGEKEKALELASVAKFWTFYISLLLSILGLIVVFIFVSNKESYDLILGVMVIIFQTWQGVFVTKYLKVLYRTNKDFNKLAIITFVVALVSFASIYFIYKYGFYGLCLRAMVIVIVDLIITWYWRPIKVPMKWNKKTFMALLKTGFPMFIVNNIYGKWPLVQRTLILVLLGTKALGLFAVVFIIDNAFRIFSTSVGSVLFPTMMVQWGKGHSIGEIYRKNIKKPLLFILLLFALIVPILWYFLPKSIHYFLPNYTEIAQAGQWMILTGFVGILNILGIFYNVINLQKERMFMYLSGVFCWGLILFVMYTQGKLSLEVFPQALMVSYLVMTLLNIVFLKKKWGKTQNSYH